MLTTERGINMTYHAQIGKVHCFIDHINEVRETIQEGGDLQALKHKFINESNPDATLDTVDWHRNWYSGKLIAEHYDQPEINFMLTLIDEIELKIKEVSICR